MEKVYNVYFITDGEISVLYSGQDTGRNFGTQFGVRQLPKNLIVRQIKNIKTYTLNNTDIICTDCELFINGVWKEWRTKRQYIDEAIKFYEEKNKNIGGKEMNRNIYNYVDNWKKYLKNRYGEKAIEWANEKYDRKLFSRIYFEIVEALNELEKIEPINSFFIKQAIDMKIMKDESILVDLLSVLDK